MTLRRRTLCAALFAALWGVAGRLAAQPSLEVSWRAPAGCPSGEEVRSRALQLLGRSEATVSLRAQGVVVRSAAGFTLTLSTELDGVRGQRQLTAVECSDLLAPAALVLAVAIDPEAGASAETPASNQRMPDVESPASPASKPASPPSRPAEPPASPPPASPERAAPASLDAWQARTGIGTLADWGTLPDVAVGASVHLGVGTDRWFVEARGSFLAPRSKNVAPDRGGTFNALGPELAGCWRLAQWAEPCLAGGAQRIAGEGYGVSDPGEGAAWVPTTSVGLRAAQRFAGSLHLFGRFDAVVPWQRKRFVLENVGEVHRPAAVWLRLTLGLETYFL